MMTDEQMSQIVAMTDAQHRAYRRLVNKGVGTDEAIARALGAMPRASRIRPGKAGHVAAVRQLIGGEHRALEEMLGLR